MDKLERIENEKRKEMARYPLLRGRQRGNHLVVIRRYYHNHISVWQYVGGMLVTILVRKDDGEYAVFYTN